MRSNVDHDICRKKEESRRLDIQVRWFLRKQKKSQPDQIPSGQSGYLQHCEENGLNPYQFSLSNQMTASVQEAYAKKGKKLGTKVSKSKTVLRDRIEDIQTHEERLLFNRNAKDLAWQKRLNTFTGSCQLHGVQTFRIHMQGRQSRCSACIQNSNRKYRGKEKANLEQQVAA